MTSERAVLVLASVAALVAAALVWQAAAIAITGPRSAAAWLRTAALLAMAVAIACHAQAARVMSRSPRLGAEARWRRRSTWAAAVAVVAVVVRVLLEAR